MNSAGVSDSITRACLLGGFFALGKRFLDQNPHQRKQAFCRPFSHFLHQKNKKRTTLKVEDKRFSQTKSKNKKSFAEATANKEPINYLVQETELLG